ncbi:MAG: AMP-binding protein [Peptococcaceae bacterium]|nr:AMP-binding protein [Peptococcaceae bacterium]
MKKASNIREMIMNSATQYPERVFVSGAQEARQPDKTYADLETDIMGFGKGLYHRFGNDVRMGIFGENSYQWIVSYYTALYFGWVVVPLDKDLSSEGMLHIVEQADLNVLVVGKDCLEIVRGLRMNLGRVRDLVMINTERGPEGRSDYRSVGESMNELIARGLDEHEPFDLQVIDECHTAVIMFTSGTSGVSKGVMLSQRNLLLNCLATADMLHYTNQHDHVHLCVLPFHHCLPNMVDILCTTYAGGTLCINRGLKELVSDLQDYRPTHLIAVPLIAEGLIRKITTALGKTLGLDEASEKHIKDFFGGRLELVVTGGAMMSEETVVAYKEAGIPLMRGYGITECTACVSMMSPTRDDYDNSTSGTPIWCQKVRIIDGEICVTGQSVMQGYYKNPEATAEAFHEEWFRTGDLGYLNEEGDLYITGRIKNVIILGSGINVYPEEIEEALLAHADVDECVVFEYAQGTHRPVIAAIIHPQNTYHHSLESDEAIDYFLGIVALVNETLPGYKHIMKFFLTAREFEKTTSRKIIRSKVCERILKGGAIG